MDTDDNNGIGDEGLLTEWEHWETLLFPLIQPGLMSHCLISSVMSSSEFRNSSWPN